MTPDRREPRFVFNNLDIIIPALSIFTTASMGYLFATEHLYVGVAMVVVAEGLNMLWLARSIRARRRGNKNYL